MLEQTELVKRLLEENETFKKAYLEHKEYKQRVMELEKKGILNEDEILEEKKLKKLKLALKDDMEQMLSAVEA
ncbi:MAG: hypothetical protein ACE5DW_02455 [Thermodesulfobacteriota bacterium]